MDWAKTTARRVEKHLSFQFGASYIRDVTVTFIMQGLDYFMHTVATTVANAMFADAK